MRRGGYPMIRRLLDGLYLLSGYLAGLFLIAIFLLMMALSVGRQLGINVPAGDDFTSWCMAAMAFLGLAHTFKSGEMIRVGLLIDRLTRPHASGSPRSFALLIGGAASSASSPGTRSISTYTSWQLQRHGDRACSSMPLWIPQLGYPGGLVILFIALIDELVHVLRGNKPRYEKEPPEDRRRSRRARRAERRVTADGPPRHLAVLISVAAGRAAGGRRVDRHRLLASGWLGMQFAAGGIPAGTVLATKFWGNARVLGAGRAAAVHLDGRDPVPHQAVGGDVPRAWRRGSNWHARAG